MGLNYYTRAARSAGSSLAGRACAVGTNEDCNGKIIPDKPAGVLSHCSNNALLAPSSGDGAISEYPEPCHAGDAIPRSNLETPIEFGQGDIFMREVPASAARSRLSLFVLEAQYCIVSFPPRRGSARNDQLWCSMAG